MSKHRDHQTENIQGLREAQLSLKLCYEFKNKARLTRALTHSSYAKENEGFGDNERLEFLGDAFVDAIISEELFKILPESEEGRMSKLRSQIVCEAALAEVAMGLDLGSYMYLGRGESFSGGRKRASILSDALEAVVAAVYLDGGYDSAKELVLRLFSSIIAQAIKGKRNYDFKTELQEILQAKGEMNISYVLEREDGPDHRKTFYIRVDSQGVGLGRGSGRSKKEAEQDAAKEALETLSKGR